MTNGFIGLAGTSENKMVFSSPYYFRMVEFLRNNLNLFTWLAICSSYCMGMTFIVFKLTSEFFITLSLCRVLLEHIKHLLGICLLAIRYLFAGYNTQCSERMVKWSKLYPLSGRPHVWFVFDWRNVHLKMTRLIFNHDSIYKV